MNNDTHTSTSIIDYAPTYHARPARHQSPLSLPPHHHHHHHIKDKHMSGYSFNIGILDGRTDGSIDGTVNEHSGNGNGTFNALGLVGFGAHGGRGWIWNSGIFSYLHQHESTYQRRRGRGRGRGGYTPASYFTIRPHGRMGGWMAFLSFFFSFFPLGRTAATLVGEVVFFVCITFFVAPLLLPLLVGEQHMMLDFGRKGRASGLPGQPCRIG